MKLTWFTAIVLYILSELLLGVVFGVGAYVTLQLLGVI